MVFPDSIDNPIPSFAMAKMPVTGWRQLTTPSRPASDGMRLFAAPNGEGWASAYLADTPDGLILSGDPGPHPVRPGRPSRRQHLALSWPDGLQCSASALNTLSVTLGNTSGQPWAADSEDSAYVHAWLLDDTGERMGSNWVAHGFGDRLRDLQPDESMELPVDFGPPTTKISPGMYGLEGVLTSLNLWTAKGTLHVT